MEPDDKEERTVVTITPLVRRAAAQLELVGEGAAA